MGHTANIDSFAVPIGTGMRRTEHQPYDSTAYDALTARLDEFDAVRNRGAVEARSAWLHLPSK